MSPLIYKACLYLVLEFAVGQAELDSSSLFCGTDGN